MISIIKQWGIKLFWFLLSQEATYKVAKYVIKLIAAETKKRIEQSDNKWDDRLYLEFHKHGAPRILKWLSKIKDDFVRNNLMRELTTESGDHGELTGLGFTVDDSGVLGLSFGPFESHYNPKTGKFEVGAGLRL